MFTETRDGVEWTVIDSNKPYHAGMSQTVYFDRPVKRVTLLVRASLFTRLNSLMVRIGIQDLTEEYYSPLSPNIFWGFWEGPNNGWKGEPRTLQITWVGETRRLVVFLAGVARWPVKNVCRWKDVQLSIEYADVEPEPPPEPDPAPDPDPEGGIAGEIARMHAEIAEHLREISQRVLEVDRLLAEWQEGQAWVDTYNENKFKKTPLIGE